MLHRFRKVAPNLYRGSAPTIHDIQYLKNEYGIKKIVSLDKNTGNHIDRTCKLLGIKHVMVPLDGSRKSLIHLLNHDLKDLLTKDGPTYFHCLYGKDRTGLVAAMFECKYMGISSAKALKEAKSLGFGIGVDPKIVKLYENIINNCKPNDDENSADIVSNEREYRGDGRDSFLDEAQPGSFSPYLSQMRQYPYDFVYNPLNDQSPTRQNYDEEPIKEHNEEGDGVPQVGVYNNDAGGRGFGPTENYSGFFYD